MVAQLAADLVALLLLAFPGWLVARALRPRPTPLQAVSETLLCALTVVPIPVFAVCLLSRAYVTVGGVAAVAGVVTVLAGAALWRRHGRDVGGALLAHAPAGPGTRTALIGAGAVAAVFLVNYDRSHFQYGCINGVVMQALTPDAARAFDPYDPAEAGSPVARALPTMDLLDTHGTGQRLGTTAVIAPVVSLFGVLGFRLVYALLPLCGFLFGVRLCFALTGHQRVAIAAALLAVLNPYVLKILILDENVMAFCLTTASLALLVEGGAAPLAGLAFGAAFGIRHIELSFALAALLLIGRQPRELLRFGAVALLFALPCLAHHQATYGSVFQHEHFVDEVRFSQPHSFLGLWDFDYVGLLNVPFTDRWIRTPYNPFPTSLYYPLNTLAHLGGLLCGVALIGVVCLLRRRGALRWALLAWVGPQYTVLAVLEKWMDPNKMGVILTLFPALVVVLALGLAWIAAHRRRLLVWAAVTVALFGAAHLARRIHVPPDPRFYAKFPEVRPERPEYTAFELGLVTGGSPLPSLYFLQQYSPFRPAARLRGRGEDLADRRFQRPAPPVGPPPPRPTRPSLDFQRPLIAGGFAQLGVQAPTCVDVRDADAAVHVAALAGWDTRPMEVLVARRADDAVDVFVRFGTAQFADVTSERAYAIEQRVRPAVRHVTGQGSRLCLTLRPTDRVRVLETVCMDEVLVYVWELDWRGDGLSVSVPRKQFHN